jgi:hypothetical protein
MMDINIVMDIKIAMDAKHGMLCHSCDSNSTTQPSELCLSAQVSVPFLPIPIHLSTLANLYICHFAPILQPHRCHPPQNTKQSSNRYNTCAVMAPRKDAKQAKQVAKDKSEIIEKVEDESKQRDDQVQ